MKLWITLGVAFILVGGSSAFFQSRKEEGRINYKPIVRDGLLGAIFTAMTWVLIPDTMTSLVSTTSSLIPDAPKLSLVGGGERPRSVSEFDLQIGSPGF